MTNILFVQVKKTSADDTDLYWWIRDQRTKFKHKKLPPEQAIHKKTKIEKKIHAQETFSRSGIHILKKKKVLYTVT